MRSLWQRGRTALPPVLASLLVALFVSFVGAPSAATVAPSTHVRRTQTLALLFASHIARARPDRHARRVQVVSRLRPITGERTALPVLATEHVHGTTWLQVRLPGRPNGHRGWIVRRATRTTHTPWLLRVDLGRRRVIALRAGRVVRSFASVVGKPSTPTPRGRFFVEETVQLQPGDVGAPYALALSARSEVLQEFDGGPGQIAVHGLAHVGGTPGTAVSHGCLRLDAAAMRWLVQRIGPGVPVTISR